MEKAMEYSEVLSYLSEKSGVPLWVLNKQAGIRYSTIAPSKLGEQQNMQKLFVSFIVGEDEKEEGGGGEANGPLVKKFDTLELFGSFPFTACGEKFTLVAGPAYEIHPYAGGSKGSAQVLFGLDYVKEILLMTPTVTLPEFCRLLSVLAQFLIGAFYPSAALESGLERYVLRDLIDEQLAETIYDIREEGGDTVYEPEGEKKLLSFVTKGDVEALKNFRIPKVKAKNAKETKYQGLFEAVALVTLATRAAIEGGLDYVEAFSLSDLYFKRLSRVVNDRELYDIVSQILFHFAQRVRESALAAISEETSPYIAQSIQYIRSHLHEPVRLEDVARKVGLEPKYFSRLFVSLTGEKFSSFVQRERVTEAKNLLENTGRTTIEISAGLGFSSQSYFIKVFTRYVGETPGEYRSKTRRQKGRV